MSSTSPSLLGLAWVELGVERVTLDSEVGDRVSGLYNGKLPGSKLVGSYLASRSSSQRLHTLG